MERFIQALESNRIGDIRAVETIFVTDYQDDYLYLKYLKFALIDVKSLVGGVPSGTKIADFLDDNFSEFIDEHIEYMDPKPTDDLRTFTKENFKKVINLLNGTEKSNRLALRTIIGKHSRDEMAGTPRAEPAAESKRDVPSFEQLPTSPINSPRPRARRARIRQPVFPQNITQGQAQRAATAIFQTRKDSAFNMPPPAPVASELLLAEQSAFSSEPNKQSTNIDEMDID